MNNNDMFYCKYCSSECKMTEYRSRNGIDKCMKCANEQHKRRTRTKQGRLKKIFDTQVQSSRKRGHLPPNYNFKDLLKRYLNDPLYIEIWSNWLRSDYERNLSPSLDRKDETKGYTFDNIQLVTWRENHQNHQTGKFLGEITGELKKVSLYDIDGIFIQTFHSYKHLEREYDIPVGAISKCLDTNKYNIKMVTNRLKTRCFTLSSEELPSVDPYTGRYRQQFRAINQYDLSGNYLKTFDSAQMFMQTRPDGTYKASTNLYRVCNGLDKSAYGFIWRWKNA